MNRPQKQDITTDHGRSGVKISNNKHYELKINAWATPESKDNGDEDKTNDDSEKYIGPGPMLSDSESEIESSTDDEANAKSKAIHARDHSKREQEKKAKKAAAKLKSDKQKKKLLHWLCLPHGILFKQQLQQLQPILLKLVNLLQQMPAQNGGHLIDYMFTM
jgi:uncharacterized membrane-anchored protein